LALTIPRSQLSDIVGASSYPRLLAIILAILSVILILTGAFSKAPVRSAAEQAAKADEDRHGFLRAAGTVAIGAGYLIVVTFTGYAIGVMLLMIAMLLYNHERFSPKIAITAVAAGIFFWLIFRILFDIPVPAGIWPQIFS